MRFVKIFFSWVWKTLKFAHTLVFGSLAILLLVLIFANPFRPDPILVPDNSALVVSLKGRLVEQLTEIDPFAAAFSGPGAIPQEVLLSDVMTALERAKGDKRIKMLYLRLDEFEGALPATLHALGEAIKDFRASGKSVAAYGDGYSQGQYLLASQADTIFMNPDGAVLLTGYGRYPLYFKSAIEKLKLTTHVFKVGTYKSAIEPFTRDDMSDADREAATAYLNTLWGAYEEDVALGRNADMTTAFNVSEYPQELRKVGGDMARVALAHGLIDELKTHDQMYDWLVEQVGTSKHGNGYNGIDMKSYLAATKPIKLGHKDNQVAVIYAVGEILDGEQPAGTVGGDTVAALIREARLNKNVKAIVLRVDSPGGSAFASEIIRRELERAQADGKPVVASMGGVAASGGYWISATADKIYAEPTTITGSIGIFGLFMTAENTLDAIGIHSDGVGTTPLAGGLSPAKALNPMIADIIQQVIEDGYEKFITLVSRGRDMTPEAVDAVGQGRVWVGSKALELGLVDELGGLGDAVQAAAKLAGVEDFERVVIEEQPSPMELLIRQIMKDMGASIGSAVKSRAGVETEVLRLMRQQLALPLTLNDPNHAYAVCFECTAFDPGQGL